MVEERGVRKILTTVKWHLLSTREESVSQSDEIAGTCDCLEPECTVVKERGECQ